MNRPVPSPRHKSILPPLLAAALAVAGLLFSCSVSPAQTTWTDSTGNGLWSDAANWDMGEPVVQTTNAILPSSFPLANTTISLDPSETAGSSGTLTISDDYMLSGGDLTSGGTRRIAVDTGISATIEFTLTARGLTKVGFGSLAVHDITGVSERIFVVDGTMFL